MSESQKKVRFRGREFWLRENTNGTFLCPLSHFSESGDLLADAFEDVSYAVIEDGRILRYHQVIGHESELEPAA